SAEGSRLAIEVAQEVAQDLLLGQQSGAGAPHLKDVLERRFPHELGGRWAARVRAHLEANPISDNEWNVLQQKEGGYVRKIIEGNPLHPYGSTIVMVVVDESFIAYFQLGDGDLVIVTDRGMVARPIQDDPYLFGGL